MLIKFISNFICFGIEAAIYVLKGGIKFYIWLIFLLSLMGLLVIGAFMQGVYGMNVTGLNDQVTWGLYLANFVFLVGLAAAAVTVVFPGYIYNHEPTKKIALLGEMLAIAAVNMCMIFVLFHMGRPDRLWHIIPGIGIFNWPNSMLTWDILALNVYLGLNAVCGFYYMYKKFMGERVARWYKPLIYVSCAWALSIHTVTAFLMNTMPTRPMWAHSVLPIKFIVTAFAAGPAFMIIAFTIIRNNTDLEIQDRVFDLLSQIVVWCLGIALFLTISELVTEFYPGTEHSYSLQFLVLGKHGLNGLVGFFWVAMVFMVGSFILLLNKNIRKNYTVLPIICGFLFVGIWIEKGLGFVIPGFTPSPIGEFAIYHPSWVEIINSIAIWAMGFLIFTLLAKAAVGVLLGEIKFKQYPD
ncbi:MAG: NrfD/PsrC family molybdoenzyme membrane anchor subunit [Thermodesulfobacteriota bacterium]